MSQGRGALMNRDQEDPCVLIYGETDGFLNFVSNGREEE